MPGSVPPPPPPPPAGAPLAVGCGNPWGGNIVRGGGETAASATGTAVAATATAAAAVEFIKTVEKISPKIGGKPCKRL